jgi:uncharacterized protein
MSQSPHTNAPSPGNSLKSLFINQEGELRSGWRVAIFILIFAICLQLIGGAIFLLGVLLPAIRNLLQAPTSSLSPQQQVLYFGMFNLVSFCSVLIANAICARWLERRSFASTGYQFHKGWLKDFALGSALGAATLTIAVGIAAAAGATSFTVKNSDPGTLGIWFIFLFFLFLFAAANEEALVRGFAFQALEHNMGAVAAVSITSALFGLMHLQNDDVTLFSTFNTILAGVWLGIAYLLTRSLWLATALHYSWNLLMAFIFGLPVSGIKLLKNFAWLDGAATKPWISGGEYGPEGGVAATLALLLCTLAIWKSGLFRTTPEMAQAIQHGKRREPSLSLTAPPVDEQSR